MGNDAQSLVDRIDEPTLRRLADDLASMDTEGAIDLSNWPAAAALVDAAFPVQDGAPLICNDADNHAGPCNCGNGAALWTTRTASSGRFEDAKRTLNRDLRRMRRSDRGRWWKP